MDLPTCHPWHTFCRGIAIVHPLVAFGSKQEFMRRRNATPEMEGRAQGPAFGRTRCRLAVRVHGEGTSGHMLCSDTPFLFLVLLRISQERTLSLMATFWLEHLDHMSHQMAIYWVWNPQREIEVLQWKSGIWVLVSPQQQSPTPDNLHVTITESSKLQTYLVLSRC